MQTSRSLRSSAILSASAVRLFCGPWFRDKPTPDQLVALTKGRLKASDATLREALRGRIRQPHRLLLKLNLDQIEGFEKSIAEVDREVRALIEPFRAKSERLTTPIPGVSDVVAQVIISEIGTDMSRFPTAAHLISWAALCPRNDESAGRRRSNRLRSGGTWLKTTLVQAAWAAARSKTGYLSAQFRRIQSRRGPKKAVVAVAASILQAAYYILRDDLDYRDLGAAHFDSRDRDKAAARLIKRLATLGVKVQIIEEAA